MRLFLWGIILWLSGVVGAYSSKAMDFSNALEPAFWAIASLFFASVALCALNRHSIVGIKNENNS